MRFSAGDSDDSSDTLGDGTFFDNDKVLDLVRLGDMPAKFDLDLYFL